MKSSARLLLAALAVSASVAESRAQDRHSPERAIVSATLSGVLHGLRAADDARIEGPIAFDPEVVRAEWGPAHRRWPDSLMLIWGGDVREPFPHSADVLSLLADGDPSLQAGVDRLVPCGRSTGLKPCSLDAFPAVVAVSKPWICGNTAQVLVFVRYRSKIDLHPYAWYASVARLELQNGVWTVTRTHNQAGT
jgi:hypothetical protein